MLDVLGKTNRFRRELYALLLVSIDKDVRPIDSITFPSDAFSKVSEAPRNDLTHGLTIPA